MKRIFTLVAIATFFQVAAQHLEQETTYEFTSLKKNSFLGSVEYTTDESLNLIYARNEGNKKVFNTYQFDKDLNFLGEKKESFDIMDAAIDLKKLPNQAYGWFTDKYKGENYSKDVLWVYPNLANKLIAKKVRYDYKFNWALGDYVKTTKTLEKQEIKGSNSEELYFYENVTNFETGEAMAIVGERPNPKDKANKWQHLRKFQLVSINKDFEIKTTDEILFDFNMGISFIKVLTNSIDEETPLRIGDLSKGNLAIIFSPIKTMTGKKWANQNPGAHTLVIINSEGKVLNRIEVEAPSSGWVVEDVIVSQDGMDAYFYGPAKDGSYVNDLTTIKSELTLETSPMQGLGQKTQTKDIKWKNFQILKISNNEFAWINNTELSEFKSKSQSPPSQKKDLYYAGKKFIKNSAMVTPAGEIIITGQNFKPKKEQNATGGAGMINGALSVVKTINKSKEGSSEDSSQESQMEKIEAYKDLIMFHFDSQGSLKAQYGVRRDQNNKYAKSILTPQYTYINSSNDKLYWIYGEIKGFRKGFGIPIEGGDLGTVSISKRKLLYYPTVAEIDLGNGKISDFSALGSDDKGRQQYYTNPEFPQVLSKEGRKLTFIGENKSGKTLWLGKMNLD